jgi:hypothetical protein
MFTGAAALLLAACLATCTGGAARPLCYRHAPRGGKTLQLLHHVRFERLRLMELYRPYMAGQLLVISPEQREEAFVALNGSTSFSLWICADPRRYVACLGNLVRELLDEDAKNMSCPSAVPAVSGLLFHHEDMFVSPQHLLGTYDTSKMWWAQSGLRTGGKPIRAACLSGDELFSDAWPWWDNSRQTSLTAIAKLREQGLVSRWPADRVCRGHSDIWHLPARFFGAFARHPGRGWRQR